MKTFFVSYVTPPSLQDFESLAPGMTIDKTLKITDIQNTYVEIEDDVKPHQLITVICEKIDNSPYSINIISIGRID